MSTVTSPSSSRLAIPALGGIYASAPFFEALLRFVVGAFLVPHGAQKLFGAFGGYGIGGTAGFMESLGFTPGVLFAVLVGAVEFFGGILIAIGFLTRPAALAAAIMLFVAALSVHWGAFFAPEGIEYPVLWAVAALFFAVKGASAYSVDAALGKEI